MKKLNINRIRKEFKFQLNKDVTVFMYASHLVDPKRDYQLDFEVFLPSRNKNLQRELVWSKFQKEEFIRSLLKGVRIPGISVVLGDDKIYRIIDGKQRLTTIISFLNNEFYLNFEGEIYYYNDFDEETKSTLNRIGIIGDIAYQVDDNPLTDQILIDWFEQINYLGTPHDKKHLDSLKYSI